MLFIKKRGGLRSNKQRAYIRLHPEKVGSVRNPKGECAYTYPLKAQGIGVRATASQAAEQVPKAELHIKMAGGATGAVTVPTVNSVPVSLDRRRSREPVWQIL
jgi:hypothetical protein